MTATIERTAFSTSRLLDFVSEKELTLQCGFGSYDWPLVAVKELVDNALDACEEQGIAPEISVSVDESSSSSSRGDPGLGDLGDEPPRSRRDARLAAGRFRLPAYRAREALTRPGTPAAPVVTLRRAASVSQGLRAA